MYWREWKSIQFPLSLIETNHLKLRCCPAELGSHDGIDAPDASERPGCVYPQGHAGNCAEFGEFADVVVSE